MNSLLETYADEMGYREIKIPGKIEIKRVQKYNIGLLKELADVLIGILPDGAVEVNHEALTNSNISTLHLNCKQKGYKLHCLRSDTKRILYVEKR